eukprot:42909-Rhodomonas_salina.1
MEKGEGGRVRGRETGREESGRWGERGTGNGERDGEVRERELGGEREGEWEGEKERGREREWERKRAGEERQMHLPADRRLGAMWVRGLVHGLQMIKMQATASDRSMHQRQIKTYVMQDTPEVRSWHGACDDASHKVKRPTKPTSPSEHTPLMLRQNMLLHA